MHTAGCVKLQLAAFLEYLRLNRNASAHTASAYESDLAQFLGFAAQHHETPSLEPRHLQLGTVRAFMAELYRQGHARASVARKLSVLLHRLWITGEAYEPLRNARLSQESLQGI